VEQLPIDIDLDACIAGIVLEMIEPCGHCFSRENCDCGSLNRPDVEF
jgi:hypothetical protein